MNEEGSQKKKFSSSISSIIPITTERQEANVLTSHQLRIENVPLSILFTFLPTQNGQRTERKEKEGKETRQSSSKFR